MKAVFVTRHSGAVVWARRQGIDAVPVTHIDPADFGPGDVVAGTLPVHIAAEICARGAVYLHLSMEVPEALRGRELSAEDMERCDARLERYRIEKRDWPWRNF